MTAQREHQQTLRIEQPILLLVEGADDDHFFRRIIERSEQEGIQVVQYNGKDNLGNFLSNVLVPRLRSSDVAKAIGVTRDADDNFAGAFQSIGGSLRIAGLPVPLEPLVLAEGAFEDTTIQVAAFVMPDNSSPGDLETLCLDAVSQFQAMPCVESYFDCLQSIGHVRRQESKARLRSFLSANVDNPKLLIGQAISADVIPWNSFSFAGIHKFLDLLTSAD